LRRDAGLRKRPPRLAVLLDGECQKEPLDGDERVACLVGRFLGRLEDAGQLRRQIHLAGSRPLYLRQLCESGLDAGEHVAGATAGAVYQAGCEALRIIEQHLQKVLRGELLVAFTQGEALRRLHEALRAVGVTFEIHERISPPARWSTRSIGSAMFL
jgi:hypothetical protein